jgi:putative tricarboxylic transport membrane protein
MKKRDLLSSFLWMGFGALFLVGSLQQGLVRKGIPGPGFLPFIAGIVLIALSLMILISALGNKEEEMEAIERRKFFPERDSLKKILFTLIFLFAYVFSLEYAGYLLATFLFMLLISRRIESHSWKTLFILAISTAILSYLLFVVLLEVQLPPGILGI